MRTRLAGLCEGLVEAGWLAALVATPLYFNQHSARSFEPDKAVLLRSIAVVVALAWIVRGIDGALAARRAGEQPAQRLAAALRARARDAPTAALLCAALAFFAVHAAAAAWSVDPAISLRGDYHRLQGLYTTTAYLVLFLSVVALLRREEQVQRLVLTVLAASFAVALYGVLQSVGLDPVVWARESRSPVRSTLGNEIFVSAFLVMTVPLTLYRLLRAGRAATEGGQRARAFLELGAGTVVLATQTACIVLSESRGPFLGLLCGLFLLGLFLAQAYGRRGAKRALVACAAGVVATLALVNTPGSPLNALRDVPVAGRLTAVFETAGAARVRLLIWQGVDELAAARPLRTVLGHGPETMRLVFPPFQPPELAMTPEGERVPDRAHNETFDTLITRGVPGLVTYFGLVVSLLAFVLWRLDALPARRDTAGFLACVGGSAAGFALVLRIVDQSWRLAGVGASLGLLVGLAIYLVARDSMIARAPPRPRPASLPPPGAPLTAALAAAALAHFAETQFGIGVVATRTLFWILVGALVATARPPRARDVDANRGGSAGPPTRRDVRAGSLVIALVLITLLVDFSPARSDAGSRSTMLWLLTLAFVFPGLLVVAESTSHEHARADIWRWLEHVGLYAFVCLCALLVAHAALRLVGPPRGPPSLAVLVYPGLVLAQMALLAFVLRDRDARAPPLAARGAAVLYAMLAAGALWLVDTGNLDAVAADIWFKRGRVAHERTGDHDAAVAAYRRALSLAPREDHYYIYLGKALAEQARRAGEPAQRERGYAAAERALRTAAMLRPLDPDHKANLARLHKSRGITARSRAESERRLRAALEQFRRAVQAAPNRPRLWIEWGETHALLGETQRALERYRRAVELAPRLVAGHEALMRLHLLRGDCERAARAARRARALAHLPAPLERSLARCP